MNQNLTILRKVLVLLAIPFAFLLIFLVILFNINSAAADARWWAIHSRDVIARTASLRLRIVELQSSLRLLVLVPNVPILDHLEREISEIPVELAGLHEFVSDNPEQQSRVLTVQSDSAELLKWEQGLVGLLRSDKRDEAASLVKSLKGQILFDKIQESLNDFNIGEKQLDRERANRLERIARIQTLALVVSATLAPILVAFVAVGFRNTINQRFAVLADNARRLADGQELSKPLEGRDEIAQADRIFHGMAQAIAEKNRENEMFIFSVSHDLRSPLVNLQGFSQELGHSCKDLREIVEEGNLSAASRVRALSLIDQDMQASIHFIQTAVSRLAVIIEALLRLSRAGRVEYRWQNVDLDEAVRRVIVAAKNSTAKQGASIEVQPLPQAWGDPTALEQLFGNLILNAVHYLDPNRKGTIVVGAAPPDGTSDRFHTYFVRDNGLGIPETALPRLFQAFQRFHEGTFKGEGIGLTLVRRIVDRHGGRIRVESQVGEGTTFFVELPARSPEGSSTDSVSRSPDTPRPAGK